MEVLLVEDNYDTAECIRLCLEIKKPEAHVLATGSFEAAAEFLRKRAFDLVILDLGNPVLDAGRILEWVHRLTDAPTFILSSLYDPASLAESLGLAINSCIQKPFSADDFMTRLSELTGEMAQPGPGQKRSAISPGRYIIT